MQLEGANLRKQVKETKHLVKEMEQVKLVKQKFAKLKKDNTMSNLNEKSETL